MLAKKLEEQFGIPPQAMKTRAIERTLFSYNGPRKKQFLAMKICMIVNRVLPDRGQRRSYRRDLTQDYLAAACGLDSRATFTHWMSYFRDNTDKDLSAVVWRKRRFSEPNLYNSLLPHKQGTEWVVTRISTDKAAGRQGNKSGRYMSEAKAQADCKQRNDQAGKPMYCVRAHELPEDKVWYADVEQIMDDWRYSEMFSLEVAQELNLNGFKPIPEWVWHPVLGISTSARLVLTYYICCGILETGWVQVHQPKVCKALGICVKTLYNAERELEKIGLIRVVGQKRGKNPGNKEWLDLDPEWRTVNKILFCPIRTMTDEEIRAERLRRLAARRALHQARIDIRRRLRNMRMKEELLRAGEQKRLQMALHACRASRLHNELLKATKGQTARINAIWDAALVKLLDAGVHHKIVSALIPHVLAPPGPPGSLNRPDTFQHEADIRAIAERSLKSAH